MWVLCSNKVPGERYILVRGHQYTVGRQDADILVPDDKSISRKHAVLEVTHPDGNIAQPHRLPVLTVKDLSKFGTLVQSTRIKGEPSQVQSGNSIKFGTMDSVFIATYEPFIVTTSCLNNPSKKETKTLIAQLGGHVVSEWRKDCTYLVMSSLSVTVKVICALISQRPIITLDYIKDLMTAIQGRTKQPDPEEYIPPLAESQLNPSEVSFCRDLRRSQLFEGKTFIFLSPKQFNKLNLAVALAGGKPVLMEEGSDDNDDSTLLAPGTCVMQCDVPLESQNLSQNGVTWVKHVYRLLKKNHRRCIPDSELGYAVLYCSTSRYCNPAGDANASQMIAPASQSLSMPIAPPSQKQETQKESQKPAVMAHNTQSQQIKKTRNTGLNEGPSRIEASFTSPTEVKQELVSPPVPSTSKHDKKRIRSEDDEALPQPKAAKTALASTKPSTTRVKEEPQSPMPSAGSSRQGPSKLSVKQSPKTPVVEQAKKMKQDFFDDLDESNREDILDEFDFMPSKKRSKRTEPESVSPGPARGNRKNRHASKSPSPKPEAASKKAQGACRSPSPDPVRSKKKSRHASRSPSPKPELDTKKRRTARRSPSPAPASGTSHSPDFPRRSTRAGSRSPGPSPDVPRRSTRAGSRSPGPSPDVPRRSTRAGSRSPGPSPDRRHTYNPSSSDGPRQSVRDSSHSDSLTSPVAKNSDRDVKKSSAKHKNTDKPADSKPEPVTPARVPKLEQPSRMKSDTSHCNGHEEPADSGDDDMCPEGFLNKNKSHHASSTDFPQDQELPAMLVKTGFCSLVVRQPRGNQVNNRPQTETGLTSGNGKPVKNFKKFRKAVNAGADQLPRIIGGSDLKIYDLRASKQVDEWLRDHAESIPPEEEEDDGLFNFNAKRNTTKRKR